VSQTAKSMARSAAAAPPGLGLAAYLTATTMLCGALVMVIEVLGSRVIGPFFGVSLFVWTSLITVTLVALAAGYAVGGYCADRYPSADLLYVLLLAAGVLILTIPFLRQPVLNAVLPAGLRWGALAGSFALFGPPLFLLGCVSPYVIRLAARELHSLGRTVGGFYAASTAGSVVGTIATGFFLIAYLGVAGIFWLCGCLLVLLAAGYFALFRGKPQALALLLLGWPAYPQAHLPGATMPGGTQVQVVHARDSFYGNLRVVEYAGERLRTRELVIDGLVQGGVDLANGLSVYEYPYLLEFLPLALRPQGRHCLVIGLGAGVVPRWYSAQGIATDVVDIDPAVARIARDYFAFAGEVNVLDARAFLIHSTQHYDYVILDVFSGDTTPGHLLSIEAVRLVHARLVPGGVLAMNLIGNLDARSAMTMAVVDTLQAVFANVAVYPVYLPGQSAGADNLVLLAYDGAARSADPKRFEAFPVHPMADRVVRHALRHPIVPPVRPVPLLLTDDFNPLDSRDLWIKEQLRREILGTTHPDILI